MDTFREYLLFARFGRQTSSLTNLVPSSLPFCVYVVQTDTIPILLCHYDSQTSSNSSIF